MRVFLVLKKLKLKLKVNSTKKKKRVVKKKTKKKLFDTELKKRGKRVENGCLVWKKGLSCRREWNSLARSFGKK